MRSKEVPPFQVVTVWGLLALGATKVLQEGQKCFEGSLPTEQRAEGFAHCRIKYGLSNSGMAQREARACVRRSTGPGAGKVGAMRGLIPSSTEECRRGALGGRMKESSSQGLG